MGKTCLQVPQCGFETPTEGAPCLTTNPCEFEAPAEGSPCLTTVGDCNFDGSILPAIFYDADEYSPAGDAQLIDMMNQFPLDPETNIIYSAAGIKGQCRYSSSSVAHSATFKRDLLSIHRRGAVWFWFKQDTVGGIKIQMLGAGINELWKVTSGIGNPTVLETRTDDGTLVSASISPTILSGKWYFVLGWFDNTQKAMGIYAKQLDNPSNNSILTTSTVGYDLRDNEEGILSVNYAEGGGTTYIDLLGIARSVVPTQKNRDWLYNAHPYTGHGRGRSFAYV